MWNGGDNEDCMNIYFSLCIVLGPFKLAPLLSLIKMCFSTRNKDLRSLDSGVHMQTVRQDDTLQIKQSKNKFLFTT